VAYLVKLLSHWNWRLIPKSRAPTTTANGYFGCRLACRKILATEKSVGKRVAGFVVGGMAISNERTFVGSRESKASIIYHYSSTILPLTKAFHITSSSSTIHHPSTFLVSGIVRTTVSLPWRLASTYWILKGLTILYSQTLGSF
jgi:hypothetical protein